MHHRRDRRLRLRTTRPAAAIALGALSICLFALMYGLLGPSLPLQAQAFGINLARQGSLMTAYALGYLIAVLVIGYVSDRIGKERMLTAGLALASAGLLMMVAACAYRVGWAAMAAIGAGGGSMEMLASAIVSDRLAQRRGPALNLLQLAFGLSALSPLLLTQLAAADGRWRLAFLALGLAALFLVPFSLLVRPSPVAGLKQIDRGALRELAGRPRLWMIALSQAAYVFSEVSLVSWTVDYLVSERAAPLARANGAVSLFWVALLAGRIVSTLLSIRVRLDRLLVGMASLATLGVTAVVLVPLAEWAWIGVGGLGLLYAGIFGTILAYAGECYPDYSGTVFGVVFAAGAAGALAGPWLVGIVAQAATLNLGFGLIAASMAAVALLYVFLGRARR